ncbi:MAG: hypothetical protein ACLQKY_07045 [Terracidiphilus sp.]
MTKKIPIDPEIADLVIREQTEAFRRKFGRDMGPQDPLFFDPHADQPRPLSDENHDELIEEVTAVMEEADTHPALIYAFRKTGRMVSEENHERLSAAELQEWHAALKEYKRKTERDNKAIELCFLMRARVGGKKASREERLASDELGISAMYAMEDGVSSFAMEGVYLNGWLTLATKRLGITGLAQGIRERLGAQVKELCDLLAALNNELGAVEWDEAMRRHFAKVEAARAEPGTWLGKPPASPARAEKEMEAASEFLGYAMHNCSVPEIPRTLVESMLLRAWLRMRVLNDRLSEEFFQRLDRNWPEAAERVDSWIVQTARPLVQ